MPYLFIYPYDISDTMSFDDNEIEETILKCHEANDGYILCPHTTVAVKYFYKKNLDQNRYLI